MSEVKYSQQLIDSGCDSNNNLKNVIADFFEDHSFTEVVELHNVLINAFISVTLDKKKGSVDPLYVQDTVFKASEHLKLLSEVHGLIAKQKNG